MTSINHTNNALATTAKEFPASTDAGTRKALDHQQIEVLCAWAERYGLDPWAGHVYYTYGRPEVTEKGALARASASGNFAGLRCRPITQEEAKALGFPTPGTGWECSVLFKEDTEPMVDYGWVTDAEVAELQKNHPQTSKTLPLVAHTTLQARARATRRALMRAFPLTPVNTKSTPMDVDTDTGEITKPEPTPDDDPFDQSPTQERDHPETPDLTHWCSTHAKPFTLKMQGKRTWYSHPTGAGAWCNEPLLTQ